MRTLAIVNARLVDPQAGNVSPGGIRIEHRRIDDLGEIATDDAELIDAGGALVAPGIVDMGVFAADPLACAAGGITRVALMPDQSPPLDDAPLISHAAAARKPDLWVHPIAAATRGLAGRELAEIGLMKAAGAVAVATGRGWIADSGVMHRLLAYAATFDLLVVAHAEDGGLTANAVATDSETASWLGLASAPAAAEAMAVARDLSLAEATGAAIHFRQLTTAAAFDLVRAAKRRGVRVTCGITPAHLLLSDTAIGSFRTFARLSPPLRDERDRLAAIEAVRDGTIDVLSSGHDPRGPEAKRLPFADAAPGMAGATTLLALSLTLVRDGVIGLPRLFEMLSSTPARLLGLAAGGLAPGDEADLVLVDEDAPWRIDADTIPGMAGNTPFDGLPVQGKVLKTIKGGQPLG
jgi:dihydroorotase